MREISARETSTPARKVSASLVWIVLTERHLKLEQPVVVAPRDLLEMVSNVKVTRELK